MRAGAPMPGVPMRSQTGSSLVAILATLAIIGALAAGFLPGLAHPKGGSGAPSAQDAAGAARTAVQSIDARQAADATTP
jgi:type II secretory pathway pseudopilin PulG